MKDEVFFQNSSEVFDIPFLAPSLQVRKALWTSAWR